MMEDIASAERSVHFETFLWKEGKLGTRVADALCERARAGVTVRVLLDATGTAKMGKATEQRLRECGCKVTKWCAATASSTAGSATVSYGNYGVRLLRIDYLEIRW